MLSAVRWMAVIMAVAAALGGCSASSRPDQANNPSESPIRAFVEPAIGNQVVLQTLKQASKSIWMEMYLLNDSEIMDSLKKAKERGVDLRVILEQKPTGTGVGNQVALRELQSANIQVQFGNPSFKQTHAKIILADDRVALIMTLDQTRADYVANREYGIIDTVPSDVAEIRAVLEADWARTEPKTENANLIWSPGGARGSLLRFIDGAKRSLDIQLVEIQDSEIEARLLSAIKRGVVIRLIVSPVLFSAGGSAAVLNQLISNGAQVRTLKVPNVHATMLVADREIAFVGSHNLTPVSIDFSRELGILVTDKRVVEGLQGTFLNDWEVAKQRQAQ